MPKSNSNVSSNARLLQFFFFFLTMISALSRIKGQIQGQDNVTTSTLLLFSEGFFTANVGEFVISDSVVDVCEEKLSLGKKSIPFSCADSVKPHYANYPSAYSQDTREIHAMLTDLYQQPAVRCKLDIMQMDPRLHVKLVDKNDFNDPHQQAHFDGSTIAMRILKGTRNTLENKRVFQYLIHHGFVANQNKFHKRGNYIPDLNIAGISPVDTEEAAMYWFDKFVVGCKRINKIYALLRMPYAKLDVSSKTLIDQFKQASANYQPYEHGDLIRSLDILMAWRQLRFLDREFNIIGKGFHVPVQYEMQELPNSLYPSPKVQKYMYANEKTPEGYIFHSRSVVNPADKEQAVLADAVILFSNILRVSKTVTGEQIVVLDAYIHELYEPYPDLLALLFKEVQAFHLDRSQPEYRACVQRI